MGEITQSSWHLCVILIINDSDRVDPYVNAITYTHDKLKVDSVKLVHVKDAKTALSDREASTLSTEGAVNQNNGIYHKRDDVCVWVQ